MIVPDVGFAASVVSDYLIDPSDGLARSAEPPGQRRLRGFLSVADTVNL